MLWKNNSITDIDTSVIGVTYTKYHKRMTILLSTLFLTDRNYDVPKKRLDQIKNPRLLIMYAKVLSCHSSILWMNPSCFDISLGYLALKDVWQSVFKSCSNDNGQKFQSLLFNQNVCRVAFVTWKLWGLSN